MKKTADFPPLFFGTEIYMKNTSLDILYKPEVLKEALRLTENAAVVYGGSDKILKFKSEVPAFTPYIGGITYIPCSFFEAEISGVPVKNIDGTPYYPAAEAFSKLGLHVVCDGRFVAASADDGVYAFSRKGGIGVNEYREIAEYLVKHKTVTEDSVPADACKTVCRRWAYNLVGSKEVNDVNEPHIRKIIENTDNAAREAIGLFVRGGDALFKGNYIMNTLDISMSSWYKYLLAMAKAFGTCGSAYYRDEKLLNDILYGLEWMYKNKYGRDKITDDGWGMISKLGWYEWAIAAPSAMISVMMIVEEYLTEKQKEDYTAFFDSLRDKPYGVGYNCLDYGRLMIGSAALKGDAEKIINLQFMLEAPFAYVDNNREFSIETFLDSERAKYTETKGQGFYTDGSYVYHTLHGLNGMYGVSHLEKTAEYLSLFQKTPLEITTPMVNNVPQWILNSFMPVMYHTAMFRTLQGRTNFPDCRAIGKRVVLAALTLIDFFDAEDAAAVKRFIGDNVLNAEGVDFYDGMKLSCVKKFNAVISELSKVGCADTESRVFYHMDKAVHKRCDWAFCVSMSSSRIFDYDSICNEGMKNWYMGDGMTEYHIKGAAANGSLDYWNYINYYKLPGITADTQPRKEVSIAQGNEYLSSKNFVGGAVLDNKYCVSAMELESYHNACDFGNDYSGGIGGKAPAHKCDLTAKKAWFMFDNEVVCLGADIRARDNNNAEVITVVDNYMTDGGFFADGVRYNEGYCANASYALLEGACGYYFPDGGEIRQKFVLNPYSGWTGGEAAKKMKTRENARFCELWLSHGINPDNEKYSYVLLPGADMEKTAEYAKNPDISVIANTGAVQAVHCRKSNVTGFVFWNSGELDGISVSKPMIAVKQHCGDTVRLSFADPTQKLKNAVITVKGKYCPVKTDETLQVCRERENTVINVDFDGSRGRSIELLLRSDT